jgi:hypothetical protein
MNFKEAKENNIFESGDIVAFSGAISWYDKWIEYWTGNYYHVGTIFVNPVTKKIYLYEATFHQGLTRSELTEIEVPFTLIKTGITWNEDVNRVATMALGKKYSYINFALVAFKLNASIFGYICSTFAGDILDAAKENIRPNGLTPSLLVNDLIVKGAKIIEISA